MTLMNRRAAAVWKLDHATVIFVYNIVTYLYYFEIIAFAEHNLAPMYFNSLFIMCSCYEDRSRKTSFRSSFVSVSIPLIHAVRYALIIDTLLAIHISLAIVSHCAYVACACVCEKTKEATRRRRTNDRR